MIVAADGQLMWQLRDDRWLLEGQPDVVTVGDAEEVTQMW